MTADSHQTITVRTSLQIPSLTNRRTNMKKPNHYTLDLQLFAEDQQPADDATQVDPSAPTVEALKKLKEASVSKETYEKLEEQYKQALDAIINGNGVSPETVEVVKPTVEELRSDLFGGKRLSNLDYWKKALSLREQLMARGETDPFLPVGTKIVPEQSDIEAANRVAEIVQECIDYADGDSAAFTNELQRRTIDVLPRR